ncbi:MAG: hypothetical protein ACK53V_22880, partial [Planctomycetota bacterium]
VLHQPCRAATPAKISKVELAGREDPPATALNLPVSVAIRALLLSPVRVAALNIPAQSLDFQLHLEG